MRSNVTLALSAYYRCDSTCLFLGDCCYDYLMKCDPRNSSFDSTITEQANIFRWCAGHSSCNKLYDFIHTSKRHIHVIDSCPIDTNTNNNNANDAYCVNENKYLTFTNYVPVVSRGIPYLNTYCAACHGVQLKDIDPITEGSTSLCHTKSVNPEYPLFHFYPKVICEHVTVNHLVKYTKLTKRIADNCLISIDPPMRYCTGGKYMEECYAYKSVHGERFTAKIRLVKFVVGIWITRSNNLASGLKSNKNVTHELL